MRLLKKGLSDIFRKHISPEGGHSTDSKGWSSEHFKQVGADILKHTLTNRTQALCTIPLCNTLDGPRLVSPPANNISHNHQFAPALQRDKESTMGRNGPFGPPKQGVKQRNKVWLHQQQHQPPHRARLPKSCAVIYLIEPDCNNSCCRKFADQQTQVSLFKQGVATCWLVAACQALSIPGSSGSGNGSHQGEKGQ